MKQVITIYISLIFFMITIPFITVEIVKSDPILFKKTSLNYKKIFNKINKNDKQIENEDKKMQKFKILDKSENKVCHSCL